MAWLLLLLLSPAAAQEASIAVGPGNAEAAASSFAAAADVERDAQETREGETSETAGRGFGRLGPPLFGALLLLAAFGFSRLLHAGCLGVVVASPLVLVGLCLLSFPLVSNVRVGEHDARSGLGPLRSALSVYYGDNKGRYPTHLWRLTKDGRYLQSLPAVWAVFIDHALPPGRPDVPHAVTRRVKHFSSFTPGDSGNWGYVDNPKDGNYGMVFIDCTHTDSRSSVWTAY
ncbi:MAG: hypothetical protein HY928_17610 [Elusimicrobia bacterium]|nr:hypothetical protein [Elusimicrobiota bacterium]